MANLPWQNAANWASNQIGGGGAGADPVVTTLKERQDNINSILQSNPELKSLYAKTAESRNSRHYDANDFNNSKDVQDTLDFYNAAQTAKAAQPKKYGMAGFDPEGNYWSAYTGELQNKLKELQMGETADKNRSDLGSQLDQQVGNLQSSVDQHKDLLDQHLGDMLKEYGLTAAMQNQKLGASFADRGLNRSSFAQRGVEGNYAAAQSASGQARMATDQAKYGMQNQVDQIKTNVQNQKTALAQQKDLGDQDSFQKYMSDLHEQTTKQMYDNEAFSKQMDAQQQQQMNQMLGGLVQTGATLALLL